MKIGIMNNSKNPLLKEIEWIGKHKFDFLDFSVEGPKAYYQDIDTRKVKKALKKYNLAITGHTSPHIPFCDAEKSVRKQVIKEMRGCLEVLYETGSPNMNFHAIIPESVSANTAIERYSEMLNAITPLAKKKGMVLMMENWLNNKKYRKVYSGLFKKFSSLKLHLDIGHAYLRTDRDMVSWFLEKYHNRLEHVHVSDNYGRQDNHLALGMGNIPWLKTIRLLKKNDYDSTLTLETFFLRGRTRKGKSYIHSRKKLLYIWNKC